MPAALDSVLTLIEASHVAAALPAGAAETARHNALALHAACGGTAGSLAAATVSYAAELLGQVSADLAADPERTRGLIDALAQVAAVPCVALGRELLRAGPGDGAELGVEGAMEDQLSLLMTFTGARSVSLWRPSDDDPRPTLVVAVGELDANADAVAAAALSDERGGLVAGKRTLARGVRGARGAAAAVIASGIDPASPAHGLLLEAAAPALQRLSEAILLRGRVQSQESLTAAAERGLARLRFDLHDGPQQDVHLLAQDLRLFRDQLRPMIARDPDEDRALGRLDDLEAQLLALDHGLRRLSTAAQSPFLDPGSLEEALTELAQAFADRTGVVPDTRFGGDLGQLSDSQQITVLALIREALSNVRKHGDAERVTIAIESGPAGLTVSITDDGGGFDPDAALARAPQAGRLGLVGMRERVRMLGGRTRIDSRPGGPTVISATLPPWPAEPL